MKKLRDGMILYHGSYTLVEQVDLSLCSSSKDFGRGFYLTSDLEQARQFVRLSVKRQQKVRLLSESFDLRDGFISVFRFHANPSLFVYQFDSANNEWLHFITANRNPFYFPALLRKFQTTDVVGGKVANDFTSEVLQAYVGKLYGEPGTPDADRMAIRRLIPNRLKDQFCFRTEEAIQTLEFVKGIPYGE